MITIFRKLRKKLISEGQLPKYLLYAIGEIALVMIGILLALQVNNWNEAKKSASNEAYILNEILNNLEEDAEQLNYIKSRREMAKIGADNMIERFEKDSANAPVDNEDFSKFLSFERYYPLFNAFEMMKSMGLKLSNQRLATSISRYYDFEQKKVNQSIQDIENAILKIVYGNNHIRSNLKKSISGTQKQSRIEFHDNRDPLFKKDLLEELVAFDDNNTATLNNVKKFLLMNEKLIEEVSNELKSSRLAHYLNKD